MSMIKCFECLKNMYQGNTEMKDLIKMKLPVFCSMDCSVKFPDNGTPEFDKRFEELGEKVRND